MLIETQAFNLQEVGEKALLEIKNECLHDFASNLKEALTSANEHIRTFWLTEGSIANYKHFRDFFGTKIKYNTKSIIFEETLYNELNNPWSVRKTCMNLYNLEYVEKTDEHSEYYRYKKEKNYFSENCKCSEFVSEKLEDDVAEENIRNFYYSFGRGEFPFLTIIFIRLGNKDHYFYTIHR